MTLKNLTKQITDHLKVLENQLKVCHSKQDRTKLKGEIKAYTEIKTVLSYAKRKKRQRIYVTLPSGEIVPELIPLKFEDRQIEFFLNSKYGTACWVEYKIKIVA